ncbi:MAG TPA: S49 family peptidase, partial [Acidimicrobiia bacterium]
MFDRHLPWAIAESAAPDAIRRVGAYMGYCAENQEELHAGIADDAQRDGLPIRVVDSMAVVPVMGPMIRRAGPMARYFGVAGTDSIRLAIESADRDPDISEILLRVDSPGGSVSGLDQLGDAIAKAETHVVVQVEGTAASAAYYVASQADEIYVGRGDLVGSIGVRMLAVDDSKFYEEMGVRFIPIDTGEHKSAGAPGVPITDEQIAHWQHIVDFYFADFLSMVSNGRGRSVEQVRQVADGRMFTPSEAQAAGLIDGVASLEETLGRLRQRIGRSTQSARA